MLPAYAGMIPYADIDYLGIGGAPRIRGDDPRGFRIVDNSVSCSPHTRG